MFKKAKRAIVKYLARLGRFRFILILIIGWALILVYAIPLSQSSLAPSEVKITNVTDSSLAVSWITNKPTRGGVILSTQSNRILRFAEFFVCQHLALNCHLWPDEIVNPSVTHYVFLKNLQPETAYYYRIYSGGRLWKTTKKGGLLPPLKTAVVLQNPSLPNPVVSRVIKANSEKAVKGALIFLTLLDGQNPGTIKSASLTAFTDKNGAWIIDLGNLRSLDLRRAVIPKKGDLFFVRVLAQNGQKTTEFIKFNQQREIKSIILK